MTPPGFAKIYDLQCIKFMINRHNHHPHPPGNLRFHMLVPEIIQNACTPPFLCGLSVILNLYHHFFFLDKDFKNAFFKGKRLRWTTTTQQILDEVENKTIFKTNL